MPEPTLTLRDLNRATLARQMLLEREKIKPLKAVERLAGMQAQVARPPFVGLWTRIQNFDREDLHALLHSKDVVRATLMRGTLHLMGTADFLSLRGAIQPALTLGMQSILRDRTKGIDAPKLMARARSYFKKPASFDGFRDALLKEFPGGDERAMAYMVRLQLPLIQIPTDEKWAFPAQADFALAEQWLKKAPSQETNPEELILRYLAAFGPATPGDAQAWSGLRNLRAVFDALRPKLVTFRDERKRELFDLPKSPRPGEDADAPVRFLPDFDNLVLSHDDRSRVVADAHRPAVVTKNLQVRATFLVDGFVAGTWKVERKRNDAKLTMEPFSPLKKMTRSKLEEEGERLLRFLEEDAKNTEMHFQF